MTTENPTPPTLPPSRFEPLSGGLSLPNVLNKLLRKPLSLLHHLEHGVDGHKLAARFLLIAIISLGAFGLVVGSFSAGPQLWMAPVKIAGGLFFSALLCLPSLYIFACLGGVEARFRTVIGLLFAVVALSGLLLVGFAPVVWLFSVSTTSAAFMGFLLTTLWIICALFGFTLVHRGARALGMTGSGHLLVWCGVFLLVTLQMPTTLRPILGPGDGPFLNLGEKRFFIAHWSEQLRQQETPKRPEPGSGESPE